MLTEIIRLALRYRILTIAIALAITGYGGYVLYHLPIDVFPDLNRPRVTVLTEALGLAPEEVETLITFPLESVVNGATGVQAVRSSSGVGLSVINIEFGWGTDIYIARQVVAEKVALAADRLPKGVRPQLAPISSIMGQFIQIGMFSEGNKTDPVEVRTLSDWVVRQRLLTIPGIAQVVTMGGGRKQFQVLVNPDAMLRYDVTLEDVEKAVADSNSNATGGYLEEGGKELLVRALGRINTTSQLEEIVVKPGAERSLLLGQVARVVERPQVKRGDSAVNGKPAVILTISKQPGADTRILTDHILAAIHELQPSLPPDIRFVENIYQQKTFIDLSIQNVIEALRDGGVLVVIILILFLSSLRRAILSLAVISACVGGAIWALRFYGMPLDNLAISGIGLMVVVLLLIFNRITFITLTAIPLSIVVTGLVFHWFGMTINTMTLGGLAVAIGELVDDAIVDVENIHRRLRENHHSASPKDTLRVVFEASNEVRNSIVFSTILVVLVFIPLFALEGMEGRLFTPLGVAYIVSILASLAVSLTVTPVLSYWLLANAHAEDESHASPGKAPDDSALVIALKWMAGFAIRLSVAYPWPILIATGAGVVVSGIVVSQLGRGFLPDFNEGSVQINVLLPPGSSLQASNEVAAMVDRRIAQIEGVASFGRRTGRAELDEHAEGVNVSEIIVSFKPEAHRSREEIMKEIRESLEEVPGIVTSVEQPLTHLISHMLSGVKAQIGIKLYGDDLQILRSKANEMKAAISGVRGVKDLLVEQQIDIPQLQIKLDQKKLAQFGLSASYVNEFIETAMNGRTATELITGERKFDVVVRLDDPFRENLGELRRLSLNLPAGGRIALSDVADILPSSGPNTINRENVRRRIIVQCNTADRDLGSVVAEIKAQLAPIQKSLPTGYFLEFSGQFESAQSATQRILLLSLLSLAAMFLALYMLFRSVNMTLQVLSALPMAAIGAVAALVITHQSLTVASMVGFISLCGIASRNGILLIAHYLHLVRHEGEGFTPEMIERAGKERLSPMLMTALTAGIALVPLVLAAGEPGKEILYPIATVIMGGLISSTLLDFFVHPALFWLFGRVDAEEQMLARDTAEELKD